MEDALEHGSNRTRIVALPRSHYRAEYEAVFGPMPELGGDAVGPIVESRPGADRLAGR